MINVKLYSDEEVGEMEYELLDDRCRFCGSDDRPFVQNDGRTFEQADGSLKFWSEGPFSVRCEKCNTEGPRRKTPWLAIAAWNRMRKIANGKKDPR